MLKLNTFNIRFVFGMIVGVACGLTACVPRILKPISIFGENVTFQKDSADPDVLIFQNPTIKASSYSQFLIAPVKIYSNEPRHHSLRPSEKEALAENFRNQLVTLLQSGYKIVEKEGPGVLRIRTAILDIQPAHMEFDEDRFIIVKLDTLLARVSMELDCSDSVTGERIATLIHTLHGEKYLDKDMKKRLLNIQDAFQTWIQSLRNRFDRAKTRPQKTFEGIDKEEHKEMKLEEGE